MKLVRYTTYYYRLGMSLNQEDHALRIGVGHYYRKALKLKPSGDRERGRVQRVDAIEHAAGLRPFTRCFGTCSSKAGKQTGDDATEVFR